MSFNGLGMSLGNLSRLSDSKTYSISAENPTGAKGKGGMAPPAPNGAARDLGLGWKCNPNVTVPANETVVIADIQDSGAIQSMWITGRIVSRDSILRIYWDNQEHPSVECPLPDFFASPWAMQDWNNVTSGPFAPVNSLPVSVNPNRGMNCFWEMPFRERCLITIENTHPRIDSVCFYQINFMTTEVPDDLAYFHAQFRRSNPLPFGEPFTIVDGIKGKGHFVGTSQGWGINNNRWWGEGEIKFFMDGVGDFPTICGTGLEDYFGGAYDWDVDGQYVTYTTPFLGMHQVLKPDGYYTAQHRHAMYRWHVMDPIRFENDLKVTIQSLGWHSREHSEWPDERRYMHGQHDINSVAFWYQTLPSVKFPEIPDRDYLEIG